jgi:hypothetical protein
VLLKPYPPPLYVDVGVVLFRSRTKQKPWVVKLHRFTWLCINQNVHWHRVTANEAVDVAESGEIVTLVMYWRNALITEQGPKTENYAGWQSKDTKTGWTRTSNQADAS